MYKMSSFTEFNLPSVSESSNSFVVDDNSNVTTDVPMVDNEAVDTILNLGKRERRKPQRYANIVLDYDLMSQESDSAMSDDNENEDSDYMGESESDDDDYEESKIDENEIYDIKADFATILKSSKTFKDDEIARWSKHFEVLMSYFDHLSADDREYLNVNFTMPSEITLPFIYNIQENKRFMKIIEYVYKLHEVDEEEDF